MFIRAIFCAVALAAVGFGGPVSQLYLTGGSTIYIVQGAGVVGSWAASDPTESAVAVSQTVRTSTTQESYEYSLTGALLAGPLDGLCQCTNDGATDGTRNFGVSGNAVLTHDYLWQNPTALFTLPTGTSANGITYDPTDGSFWIADFFAGVRHFSGAGAELGSAFLLPNDDNPNAIAFDPADQTLWVTSSDFVGRIYQFNRSGLLLDTMNGLPSVGNGAEFAILAPQGIPEPSTMLLVCCGLLVLAPAKAGRRAAAIAAQCFLAARIFGQRT